MGNHRSSSILLLHTLYIYLCMYIQRKRLFFGNIGGFYRLSCACGEHRAKQPSRLFSTYLTFSKFVQQNLTFSKLCNRFHLWPRHPASTHSTTGSGSTAPSPSTVDAEHLCSGGVPKSSLAHGAGAEGSLVWHTVAQKHPDWHCKGLPVKTRGASATRLPFKVLREALVVQAETLPTSQCSAGTAAVFRPELKPSSSPFFKTRIWPCLLVPLSSLPIHD